MKKSKVWRPIDSPHLDGLFIPGHFYCWTDGGAIYQYRSAKASHEGALWHIDEDGSDYEVPGTFYANEALLEYIGKSATVKAIYASMKRAKIFE